MSYESNTDLEAAPVARSATPWGRLINALNGMGSIVIGLVMLLMCADVLLRNLINAPIDGVAELVATSIIVIVFLQLPATVRQGRMARADLFLDPLLVRRPGAGRRLRGVFSLLGAFACALITYASVPLLQKSWGGDEYLGIEGVFSFPIWPMRAAVVLGSVLAAIQYALLVAEDFKGMDHD